MHQVCIYRLGAYFLSIQSLEFKKSSPSEVRSGTKCVYSLQKVCICKVCIKCIVCIECALYACSKYEFAYHLFITERCTLLQTCA